MGSELFKTTLRDQGITIMKNMNLFVLLQNTKTLALVGQDFRQKMIVRHKHSNDPIGELHTIFYEHDGTDMFNFVFVDYYQKRIMHTNMIEANKLAKKFTDYKIEEIGVEIQSFNLLTSWVDRYIEHNYKLTVIQK